MTLRSARTVGIVRMAAVAAVAAVVAGGATAIAEDEPANAPAKGEPANIGEVKNDVLAYYGDYLDPEGGHHYSENSRWARDVAAAVAPAKAYLRDQLADGVRNPAIVLDVDDTSETTFGWEADNDFGYDPAQAEEAINNGEFEPITPVRALANWAAERGVRVFFLTGRPEHQRAATLRNLAREGFPKPRNAFLKPEDGAPDYLPCGTECTTVQYKSGTRRYIESRGNTVVLNLGDQLSDLEGGHARRAVKLPNPMYFID